MSDPAIALLVVACLLAWLGFALLALSQERHFERFYTSNRPPPQSDRAQVAIGIIAICAALPVCIGAQSPSFGSLLWVLITIAAATGTALQLTWAPRLLLPVAWLTKNLFHSRSLRGCS